jgi:serine protease Do
MVQLLFISSERRMCAMGYYDQQRPMRKKDLRNLKSGLAGALAGVLITSLFYSQMSSNNNHVNAADHLSDDRQVVKEIYKSEIQTEITTAIEKAIEAVVGVSNIKNNAFLPAEGMGTGSGVIYKKSGEKAYVITNHHVIEGANQIEVTLNDGTKESATLIGSDVITDLAVLEINSKNVSSVAELGSSETLKLGEPVVAIGNPLGLHFSGSVTQGIISGKERSIPVDLNRDGRMDWQSDVIQTDAAINPGNSGGPLINVKGDVIGINSMKIAQQAVEGIGLAIPMSVVQPVIEDLEKYKQVQRPYMGIGLKPVSEIPSYHLQETLLLPAEIKQGVAVLNVMPESPASKAGLEKLDVIVAIDDQTMTNDIEIRKYLYQQKDIGDKIEIAFYRAGQLKTVEMTLESRNRQS